MVIGTRDYVLRQIHRLVHALAQVTLRRQAEQYDEAETMIRETLTDVTGVEFERLRSAAKDDLLELCFVNGRIVSEKAVAIADLFREDSLILEASDRFESSNESLRRALWLYQAARDAGGLVPLDLASRIEAVEDALGGT